MTKKVIYLPLFVSFLASCGPKIEVAEEIKFISPTGAPALAFYDQGSNEYFTTNSTPTNVAAELQKSEYDCVIFDSISGLKSIKKNASVNGINYKLAKIITAGNFYLVSINKDADYGLPKDSDKVVSFGQNLIPDLVYSKLCESWGITNNASYVASVKDAGAVLSSGKYSGEDVDFVFIAEPVLTSVKNNAEATIKADQINIVKDIRKEWKTLTGQDGLAQAGIFVNTNSLETKKTKLTQFMRHVESSIDIAIKDPDSVANAMNAYGSVDEQASRFGFNANLVKKVQGEGRNGFGLLSPSETVDVNAFLAALGQDTFSEDYFVNL